MKITKGAVLFLFLMVLTAGMVGAAAAATAEIYADTSSIVGTAETGVTYTIPVTVSACDQKLTGFTIDIPQLVDANGNTYADITVKFMEDPDEPGTLIPVPADSAVGRKGSYESNKDNPTRIVWYYSKGVTLSDETILFYLNVTINGSMKYPGSSIPVNVLPTEWSVDGALSDDKKSVTKYISVKYPASVPASVEITAPTGSLAYNAKGTAAAKVIDQYGDEMTADLTWTSSAPASLEFTDAAKGAYHVKSCAAGTVEITATTSNSKSDKVTVSLTKADPKAADFEITGAEDIVYDGMSHTVTAEPKSGIEGVGTITVLYNGVETAPSALGTYPITLNVAEGANYNAATGLETGKQLKITKAVPTKELLSYSLDAVDYDGTAKSVSVAAKAGVTGIGDISIKYDGVTTAPVTAGTYEVTVDITEGTNYRDVTALSLGSFVINKIALQASDFTVTPSLPASVTYDGTDQPVTVTVKDGIYGYGTLTVLYDGENTVPKNVKEYAVTVTAAEGQNYIATSSPIALGKLTITAKQMTDASISITAATSEFTYDGTAKTPGITVMDGGITLIKDTDYTITNESATNAGTYVVVVTGKGNYAGTNSSVSWTINKATTTAADFTYTITPQIEYDGLPHAVNVTSSKITDGTITVTYNGASEAPVSYGTYQVNVSVSGATNYTDASNINLGQFEITKTLPKAADFIYTEPSDLVYSKTAKEATVTASVSELQGNFTVKYYQGDVETSPIAVGTYDVVAVTQATANYAATNVTVGSFTITQKSIAGAEVVLDNTTLAYNAAEQTVSVTAVTLPGSWVLDSADYTVSGNTAAAAGDYTVTVTGKGNYSGTATASWKITTKDISSAVVTLSNTSVAYTGSEQTVTVNSVVLDEPYGTLSAADYSVSGDLVKTAVGEYTVTVTGKGNYTGTAAAKWNITKATPTAADFTAKDGKGEKVTFPLNIDFDNAEHKVTVTAADGIEGMGNITSTTYKKGSEDVPAPKVVGEYEVFISTEAGANYEAVSDLKLGVIKINSKVCTITYVTNGGTEIAPETYQSGVDTKVLSTTTTRTGYNFAGWYADAEFTGTAVTRITPEEFGDKTFYAKWEAVPYVKDNKSDEGVFSFEENSLPVSKIDVGENDITQVTFEFKGKPETIAAKPSGYARVNSIGDAFELTVTGTPGTPVKVYFHATGSNIFLAHFINNAWEFLKAVSVGNNEYYAEVSSFSPFQIVSATPQSSSSSHSSSRDQGSSVWLKATPTPTAVPTQAAEPTQGVPSVSPVNQPTPQTSTPAPFIGILAGLGAAGLLFTLRRK